MRVWRVILQFLGAVLLAILAVFIYARLRAKDELPVSANYCALDSPVPNSCAEIARFRTMLECDRYAEHFTWKCAGNKSVWICNPDPSASMKTMACDERH
jgi:hypothetical protein